MEKVTTLPVTLLVVPMTAGPLTETLPATLAVRLPLRLACDGLIVRFPTVVITLLTVVVPSEEKSVLPAAPTLPETEMVEPAEVTETMPVEVMVEVTEIAPLAESVTPAPESGLAASVMEEAPVTDRAPVPAVRLPLMVSAPVLLMVMPTAEILPELVKAVPPLVKAPVVSVTFPVVTLDSRPSKRSCPPRRHFRWSRCLNRRWSASRSPAK